MTVVGTSLTVFSNNNMLLILTTLQNCQIVQCQQQKHHHVVIGFSAMSQTVVLPSFGKK